MVIDQAKLSKEGFKGRITQVEVEYKYYLFKPPQLYMRIIASLGIHFDTLAHYLMSL